MIKKLDPVDVRVGSRVRELRMARGMSQEKLGAALKLTFQQVQKYEKGVNRIGSSRLSQIAAALDVPIGALFEGVQGGTGDDPASASFRALASTREGQRIVHMLAEMSPRQVGSLADALAALRGAA